MRRQLFDTLRVLVRQRREDEQKFAGADVAADLCHTPDGGGELLSEDAVVQELVNVMFAGHETTGNVLAWAVECVVSRPEVLERVCRELEEVLGDGPIQAVHFRQLEFLDAVIEETVRYRPPAPMAGMRKLKEPFELGGYQLPAGTVVTQCFPVMGHRPDIFVHPDNFDAEAHFYQRQFGANQWCPFGGGRRTCLGKGLARVELAVVLAELFRNYRLTIRQKRVRSVRDGVFFGPSHGLRVVASRRRSCRPPSAP